MNPPGKYKSFVIKGTNDPGRLKSFCQLLDRNHIQYGSLGEATNLNGWIYKTGKNGPMLATAEDLVISAYQPRGLLTQILLEPAPGLVDSLTYDITAWSLIHAYGLEAIASSQKVEITKGFEFPAPVPEGKDSYAYLVKWTSLAAPQFLAQLLGSEVKVRFALQPFQINGQDFDRGTLVITKGDNRKLRNFEQVVSESAKATGVSLYTSKTGFMDSGSDFGSRNYRLIREPNIGVLGGSSVSSNSFGQVWHFFDQTLNYPLHIFETSQFSRIPLNDLNTLILTDGRYNLSERQESRLNEWIRGGGHLILLGSANRSFLGDSGFIDRPEQEEGGDNQDEIRTYGDEQRRRISDFIPGAIIPYDLDETHPLAFGLGDQYYSLKTNNIYFGQQDDAWNVGVTNENIQPLGFIGSNLKKQFSEKSFFVVQNKGGGRVTYIADNPLFRGFWYNGQILFSNALFFGG